MLRTSARAATATAPHSPTRPRTLHYHSPSPLPRRQPTSSSTAPWRPGDPILFAAAPAPSSSAVASPAQVNREERCTTATTTTATASSSAARGWRAGDPIQFASSVASLPAASPPAPTRRPLLHPVPSPPPLLRNHNSYTPTLANSSPSSPRTSLANTTTSQASWTAAPHHRWDPPSPALSRCSSSGSTMRFEEDRSYARVPEVRSSWEEEERAREEEEGVGEVEFGSFGAMDEYGSGKVTMGVQAGSPRVRKRNVVAPPLAPSSSFATTTNLSQTEVDDLLEGVDFDDDIDMFDDSDSSLGSIEDFHSAVGSPLPIIASSSRSRFTAQQPLPPSPLSVSTGTHDLFSPTASTSLLSSPNHQRRRPLAIRLSSPARSQPQPSARPFSTSSINQNMTQEEMMAVLQDDVENLPVTKPRLPTREVLEISDEDSQDGVLGEEGDSSEVEIVPNKIKVVAPPTTTTTTTTKVKSSSGWFTKPVVAKPSTAPASAAVGPSSFYGPKPSTSFLSRAKPAIPTTTTSAPPKTTRQKATETRLRKAAEDSLLRSKYPHTFRFDKWSSRKVELIYTTDEKVVDEVLERMEGPLGFDLEWEPSVRKGKENRTALVQVCDERVVLLVHVAKMKRFPNSLKNLIENPRRIKLGVQIAGDARKLVRDFSHKPAGLLELNNVARVVDAPRFVNRTKPGLVGLQELCGIYLERYLSKETDVRMGSWGGELGEKQQYYAANDVYSSLQIYLFLQSLALPTHDILAHVSSNCSTVSSFNPLLGNTVLPPPRSSSSSPPRSPSTTSHNSPPKSHPTPRQLESYTLWHTQSLPIETVATTMGIKPVSVVWGLISALGTVEGRKWPFEARRLIEGIYEVGGWEVERMVGGGNEETIEWVRELARREEEEEEEKSAKKEKKGEE